MIKGIANFILAVSSVSVPAVAGSMMYTYTEDKHPTTFEKLELKKIEIVEDDVKPLVTQKDNVEKNKPNSSRITESKSSNTNVPAGGSDSKNVSQDNGSTTSVAKVKEKSNVKIETPEIKPQLSNPPPIPHVPPQPPKPEIKKPDESPKKPEPKPEPVSPTGPGPGPIPSEPQEDKTVGQEDNTQGIEITEKTLNLWINQEIANKPDSSEHWKTILTMMTTFTDERKKELLSEFQFSKLLSA